jgi:Ca-activated chloride channel family protein
VLELAYPWLLLLLPLPLLVSRFVPPYKERKGAVQVPFFQRLVELTGAKPSKGAVILQRMLFQKIWLTLAWTLIVLALARPEFVGAPIVKEKSGRDLMVAVDLSGSMQATDFVNPDGDSVDRLVAVKSVLAEFIAQRQQDRLGLVVFGDAAFLQVPFTEDHDAWLTLLNETQIGMAGMSTVLGDAIGLSIKLFENSDTENRVLIALTDGNDTGSKVPPVEAAKVAKKFGVTVYTIAIGDPETSGERALDVETLKRISEITGGAYYQALDREQLQEIYQRITELEPELFESLSYRPRQSLHHYPIAIVASVYMVFFLLMTLLTLRQQLKTDSSGVNNV